VPVGLLGVSCEYLTMMCEYPSTPCEYSEYPTASAVDLLRALAFLGWFYWFVCFARLRVCLFVCLFVCFVCLLQLAALHVMDRAFHKSEVVPIQSIRYVSTYAVAVVPRSRAPA
jgi:hypothetical protein